MSHSSRSSSSESASWRVTVYENDNDDNDSCVDTSTSNQLDALGVSQVDDIRSCSIFAPSNPPSAFSLEVLETMRAAHDIPETIPLVIPTELQRPDSVYSGWTVMYYIFLKQGARFPLPRLVLEACEYHGLAPSQLMPNVWRILMAIQVLSEKRGVHFSYSDVMIAYRLHRPKSNENRYIFVNQLAEPLIQGVGDSYKQWARDYFLVPFVELGASAYCNIPHSWSELRRSTPTNIVPTAPTVAKIKWFFDIPSEERFADSILTEDNICSTSLRGNVPTEATMSNRPILPLLGDKAMEMALQLKKKGKKSAGPSGEGTKEVVEASTPSAPKVQRKKKRSTDADPADASDRLVLDVSPSGCARSDFNQMSEEFKKLVLDGDRTELKKMGAKSLARSHFRKCFEGMQEAAIFEEEIMEFERRESAHKAEKKKWLSEKESLTSQFSREKADWEATVQAKDRAARKMKEEHDTAVALFEDRLMEVRVDAEVRTMGRAAQLYEEAYPGPWDVSQYKAQLAQWERLNAGVDSPTENGNDADDSTPPCDG